MPKRRTHRRRALQRGGGFFDTMRNSFRRIFTSSPDSVAPSTAPTALPKPVVMPTAPAAPAAPAAPPAVAPVAAPLNRRTNKPNIVPPAPNQKSDELMIGGSARRSVRRSHRRRRTHRRRN